MRMRNGPHGYGVVTKVLHWLTVLAIVAQFAVGRAMDLDGRTDRQEDLLDAEEDRLEDAAEGRADG